MKAWGLAAALGAWLFAALFSCATALGASTYTWGNLTGGGGSWDTPANWAGNAVPAPVAGDTVNFQVDFTTAAPIITLDGARTLGKLYLGDTGSPYYDITVAAGAGGSLVFNNGGSASYIYASAQGAGGDTISAPITLNSALYISNSSTGTAVLTLSGPISGNGYGLTTIGSNSVTVLSGTQANTFTGTTNINIGTLQLNKTAGIDAIAGDIVISNGTLKLMASNQIKDTAKVTLNSGTFNLNGQSDDFASFTFNGGTLSSTADLSSSLSWLSTNTITYSGVSAPARISAGINMGSSAWTYSVNNGTAAADLTLSGVLSGVGASLVKTGAGRLDITNTNNSYTGSTVVKSGTVAVSGIIQPGVDSALGNTTSAIVLGDTNGSASACLLFATPGTHTRDITVQAGSTGFMTIGGSAANAVVYAGTLTLNKDVTLTAVSGGTFDVATVIGGSGAVIVTGAGTVIFSGTQANTYTGVTYVNNGTLQFNKTGGVAVGPISLSGGTITTGTCTLTLSGTVTATSITGAGSTITGNLDLGGATRTFTANPSADPVDLTVSAVITNGSVAKSGDGTVVFSGTQANTYTGTTYVNTGTLKLAKPAGVNAIAGDIVIGGGTLVLNADNQIGSAANVTLNSGTFNLNNRAYNFSHFTFNGGTLANTGGVFSDSMTWLSSRIITCQGAPSSTATISSDIVMGDNAWTFGVNNPSARLTLAGVLSGAGASILKTGPGTLEIAGVNNTYTGETTILAGTLAVDGTVAPGVNGALGNSTTPIMLGDTSGSESAALLFTTTSVQTRAITVRGGNSGTMTIGSTALFGNVVYSGVLTLNKDVTFVVPPAGTFDVRTLIAGSGVTVGAEVALRSDEAHGTVVFSGTQANTYTGTTYVKSGTLIFNKPPGMLAACGKSFVVAQYAGLRLMAADQMPCDSTVVVEDYGLFDLNGQNQTIASLDMHRGSVTTGKGILTLGGSVTGSNYSDIDGKLDFAGASPTFTVDVGILTVEAIITNGGIVKSGTGSLFLSGTQANTYTGTTYVNAGYLYLSKLSGIAVAGDIVIAGGTLLLAFVNDQIKDTANVTVNSGTFDLNGRSENVNNLVLNGGNVNNTGALTVSSLSLTGSAVITGAGTLTISGGNLIAADSIGKLGIAGKLAFANSGKLNLNFVPKAGMVAGTDYSQVNVTGTASLANSVLNVYLPVPSATFNPDTLAANGPLTILTSGNDLSAQAFGTINVSAYGDRGYTVTPTYGNGFVKLSIEWTALPGDADLNGTIDGGDYDLLVGYFGATSGADWTMADFDYNGKVDGGDYDLLVGYFGNTYPGVGAANIPEPGTLALLALGVIGLVSRRKAKTGTRRILSTK